MNDSEKLKIAKDTLWKIASAGLDDMLAPKKSRSLSDGALWYECLMWARSKATEALTTMNADDAKPGEIWVSAEGVAFPTQESALFSTLHPSQVKHYKQVL